MTQYPVSTIPFLVKRGFQGNNLMSHYLWPYFVLTQATSGLLAVMKKFEQHRRTMRIYIIVSSKFSDLNPFNRIPTGKNCKQCWCMCRAMSRIWRRMSGVYMSARQRQFVLVEKRLDPHERTERRSPSMVRNQACVWNTRPGQREV